MKEEIKNVAAPASQAQAAPVARLQQEISDRPFSKGNAHFEIVILDRARCHDGMELFAAPAVIDQPALIRKDDELKRIAAYWEDQARRGCVDALKCALSEAWEKASAAVIDHPTEAEIRARALEEAANVAEDTNVAMWGSYGNMHDDGLATRSNIVAAIRALASKEAAPAEVPSQESQSTQVDAVMAAIQHACGSLPAGYEVVLEMENGAGGVVWTDDEGSRHVIDGEGYLSQDIYEAVEKAQAHAVQSHTQGESGGEDA